MIATLDTKRRIGVYDVAGGRFLWRKTLDQATARGMVDIDKSGTLVAVPDEDYAIHLLDARDGKVVGTALRAHRLDVTSVRFSADGRTLYSGGLDSRLIAWDVASGMQLATLPGRTGAIQVIAASRDGRLLAASSHDGRVLLWRLADRLLLATFHLTGSVTALAFDPDFSRLAAADVAGKVAVWPVSQSEWKRTACTLAGRDLTSEERAVFIGDDVEGPVCSFSEQTATKPVERGTQSPH